MQFGIFTVGDITTDPATGKAPSEHQRIKNTVEMAVLAEQAGLDFFATGEHHNPPFAPSSPTTLLANIAARTDTLLLTTATTLITTNDPVRLAEEYAYLQHLSDGRVDLMMGRGNTGPVYPWFGKDIRKGISLAVENYDLLRRLWRETNVDWEGEFRTALQDFTSMPRPLDGVPPFVWHASIRSPQIAEQAAYYGDGYLHNNIFWPIDHVKKMVDLYRERFAFYGHGKPEQAIVGLGGQIFAARSEAEAIERYTPLLPQHLRLPGGVAGGDDTAHASRSRHARADRGEVPDLPGCDRRLPASGLQPGPGRRPAQGDHEADRVPGLRDRPGAARRAGARQVQECSGCTDPPAPPGFAGGDRASG